MKIFLKQGNILDIPADILICSANVCLNLTGGVGADIVDRYGNSMQAELHTFLKNRTPRSAKPGEVFVCSAENMPYKAVLHVVAVDPFYKSSSDIITKTVRKALTVCADFKAETVALTALASGFGDLTLEDFSIGVRPLLCESFGSVEKIIIPQIQEYRFKELCQAFPEGEVI